MRKGIVFIGTAAVVAALDQFTKWLVIKHLALGHAVSVVDGFFQLVHVRNTGVAFGFLASANIPFRTLFFVATSAVAMIIILTFIRNLPPEKLGWLISLGLVFGGAWGNLIDRVMLGEVVDFLDFSVAGFHWPAFNIADSAVTVGAIWLGINIMRKK